MIIFVPGISADISFIGVALLYGITLLNRSIQNNLQSLIASFLIQHKNCSLPGIGTLSVDEKPAEPDFLSKQIAAPHSQIKFSASEQSHESLISFIARKKQTGTSEARSMLNEFCGRLKNSSLFVIPGIGSFKKLSEEQLVFEAEKFPVQFAQPVLAERVIHPEAEHPILVGDKETTNTAMTEYYTDEPVKKSRWWIWAIVLAAIGLTIAIIHFSQKGFSFSVAGSNV